MRWLEIIELRVAGKDTAQIAVYLKQLMEEMKRNEYKNRVKLFTVKLYNHATVKTDYSIHITHKTDAIEANGSRLGLTILSTLKEFGLVNHRVWLEKR